MRHGSLFSGIGGFDLAAEWMGWENVFHCEISKFNQRILKYYWPNAISYDDIKKTDFTIHRGRIDIVTGGDPCQPHSVAGLGKGTADERFLWPQMFRAIREIQPAFIVNENVAGSVTNGVLDLKIDDLESEGYSCQAFDIPAEAVGALHQRERIWLVAYNANADTRCRVSAKVSEAHEEIQSRNQIQLPCEPVNLWIDNPDTHAERQQKLHSPPPSQQTSRKGYQGTLVSALLHMGISHGTLLNPQLYECFMGFPKDWTIPGETNVSKRSATPLSRRSHTKFLTR